LALPSVPCFELWLLLHFADIHAFFERTEVFRRLRTHIPGYEKGAENVYAVTESSLDQATQRAKRLQERFSAYTGTDPYTLVNEVVELLRAIRRPPP
jgi:hypothetical protein